MFTFTKQEKSLSDRKLKLNDFHSRHKVSLELHKYTDGDDDLCPSQYQAHDLKNNHERTKQNNYDDDKTTCDNLN